MVTLDAKNEVVSPALARRLMNEMQIQLGAEPFMPDLWAEMHPLQGCEWEKCGVFVQLIRSVAESNGFFIPKTFMGLPLEFNAYLSPTVILIRNGHYIVAKIVRLGLTNSEQEQQNG